MSEEISEFNETIAELCSGGTVDELFESAFGMISVAIYRCRSAGGDELLNAIEQVELTRRLLSQEGIDMLRQFEREKEVKDDPVSDT